MDLTYAKHILATLADVIHPVTGEILPDSDSANQPEVIRAITTVLRALDAPVAPSRISSPPSAVSPGLMMHVLVSTAQCRKSCSAYRIWS